MKLGLRYWTRIRKIGCESVRFESNDIKDLWYTAYNYVRKVQQDDPGSYTFRIYDVELENNKAYARFYYRREK